MNHGEATTENKNRRNFHIVTLNEDTYKLQIKKFGMWVFVREGFKHKVFQSFSDVVQEVQKRKKHDKSIS
jgi:hypothetical protein